MSNEAPTVLAHDAGEVYIEKLVSGRSRVTVALKDKSRYVPRPVVETGYPVDLIQRILDIKGPAYLGDEIARDEDPTYTEATLLPDLLAFQPREWFAGKRILDFGCGSGASTMILGRTFPNSEIIGIELEEKLLSIARLRAEHYGLKNVKLLVSPSGTELPPDLGTVDAVVLSAVFEHLLPNEREFLLPKIWSTLNPGGILFIDQTPHRWFPIDPHTTYLPLINYLPDSLAHLYACSCSKLVKKDDSWPALLRAGIRGGSEREILGILRQASSGVPHLLEPTGLGLKDRIDLWYAGTTFHNYPRGRRLVRDVAKVFHCLTGVAMVPYLSVAIRKV